MKDKQENELSIQITELPFREFIDQIEQFHGGFDLKLFLGALEASKITFGAWYDEKFTKNRRTYIDLMKIKNHNIVILNDGYNVEEIQAARLPISHMIIDIEDVGSLYRVVNRAFNLKAFL